MKKMTTLAKALTLALLTFALTFAGEKSPAPVLAPLAEPSSKATAKVVADSVIQSPSKAQVAAAKAVGNTLCPISGGKLGSMGMAVPVLYKGQVVRLCCAGCAGEFAANPEKFLKMAQDEVAAKK